MLLRELNDRFEQKELLPQVLRLETILIKAANGENYDDVLRCLDDSCYSPDLDFNALKKQLPLLVDVAKKGAVRKVTSIRTICEAMNETPSYKKILSEIHKLLRLYLVVPVTSASSERTFSVLKRLLVYLRSTKTEMRLNNCLLLHVHKDVTDAINLEDIAKEFVTHKVERKCHFGSF